MSKKKMALDTLNFVGAPAKYKRAVSGPYNSKKVVKPPKGYHFTDHHKSHTVKLNGDTYNFYVTEDSAADLILFKGPYGTKSKRLHRSYNSHVYIRPPKHYLFNDNAKTKKVTCQNKKHILNVRPEMVADQIHFANDEQDDTTVVGTYGRSSHITVPKHCQLKKGSSRFVFNGGVHKFTIEPSAVKDVLIFKDQDHHHRISLSVKGVYGRNGQIMPPAGYRFADKQASHDFVFNGQRHVTSVVRLTAVDKVTYLDSKHKKIAEHNIKGPVLASATKAIDQHVPDHYHVVSGDQVLYSANRHYQVAVSNLVTDQVALVNLHKIILTKKGHYNDSWLVKAPDHYQFKNHKNEVKLTLSGGKHTFKLIHDPYRNKLIYIDALNKKALLTRTITGYAKTSAEPVIKKLLPKGYQLITNVDKMTFGPSVKFSVKVCHQLMTVRLNYVYDHKVVAKANFRSRGSFVIGSYPKGLPDGYVVVDPSAKYSIGKKQQSVSIKPLFNQTRRRSPKKHGLRKWLHKISSGSSSLVSLIANIF